MPGGNIQTGYLYLAGAVLPTSGNGLTGAPGDQIRYLPTEDRIGADPDGAGGQTENPDFAATRKSLPIEWSPVGYTDAQGGSFWTVNNHLSSKGGSAPLFGDELDLPLYSEPLNESAIKREGQAEAVHDFIASILNGGPTSDDKVIALGDFNDFQFFPVVELITGELERTSVGDDDSPSTFAATGQQILAVLNELLPAEERYSYNFDGNAQALDQILATYNLLRGVMYDIVHMNSEFRVDERVSDHDPSVTSVIFERSAAMATAGDDRLDPTNYLAFFGAERGSLAGDDIINGLAGNDTLSSFTGDDSLVGGLGDDVLFGERGDDTMIGGEGDDAYNVDSTGDVVVEDGGEGDDRVVSSVDWTLSADTERLVLQGPALLGTGNDLANVIRGNGLANRLEGREGGDHVLGGGGGDTLLGELGADTLKGENGADSLVGGAGADRLDGGGDSDTLIGGDGVDLLTGGGGADVFTFLLISDSAANAYERLNDFSQGAGDLVDLSAIDAIEGTGPNDAFDFVTTFSGAAGEAVLSYNSRTDVTMLRAYVDDDADADFVLRFLSEVTEDAFVA